MSDSTIHISSGAVVFRKIGNVIEVLVLHRKAQDTWHLPKGTALSGESLTQTAAREVLEETGYTISISTPLGEAHSSFIKDGKKFNKKTSYFLATVIDTPRLPHDNEHDAALFLPSPIALEHLKRPTGYEEEAEILNRALRLIAEKP